MAFSRVSTGDSVIPSSCEMKYEPAFKPLQGKPGLLLSQGIPGTIPLGAENTESLSHSYFVGKAPLEVLSESWLTSSVEDREAFSSRDVMVCMEHSSTSSTEIDDPLYLRSLSQGISRGS